LPREPLRREIPARDSSPLLKKRQARLPAKTPRRKPFPRATPVRRPEGRNLEE